MGLNNIEIGPKTKAVIEELIDRCPDFSHQKGVSREGPRQFTKTKMRCVCYVAIGIPGVDISAMTGVKNGTLRQWKMESRFKQTVATVKHYLSDHGLERRKKGRRTPSERRQSNVYGR